MQAGQASDRFTIAVPREFYAQWLSLRLASYQALHPEVMFHLVADEHAGFTEANLDLAVRLTDGPGDMEGMVLADAPRVTVATRSEEHTSELPSLMRNSYTVFCLKQTT